MYSRVKIKAAPSKEIFPSQHLTMKKKEEKKTVKCSTPSGETFFLLDARKASGEAKSGDFRLDFRSPLGQTL
jgi:hypothetical protein